MGREFDRNPVAEMGWGQGAILDRRVAESAWEQPIGAACSWRCHRKRRRPPLPSPLPGPRIRLPFAWRPSVRGRGRRECFCAMVPLPETSRVALSSVAFRHLWFVAWGPMAATSCPARGPHSILRTPPEEPEPRRNCRIPAIRPQPSGKDGGSSSSLHSSLLREHPPQCRPQHSVTSSRHSAAIAPVPSDDRTHRNRADPIEFSRQLLRRRTCPVANPTACPFRFPNTAEIS